MSLSLAQKQRQILSARQIQSTQILQMNSVQLETYIRELSMDNPVIEVENSNYESMSQPFDQNAVNSDYQVYDNTYYQLKYNEDENEGSEWNFVDKVGETLEEYLHSQIMFLPLSRSELSIAEYIIYNLDERGYLLVTIDDISNCLGVSKETAEYVLTLVHTIEPAGICARNLEECLILQLKSKNKLDKITKVIIEKYLNFVSRNNYKEIAHRLKLTVEEVKIKCELIKTLNPKPGSGFFSEERSIYPKPDVFFIKEQTGYRIEINTYNYPGITMNQYYLSLAKSNTIDSETKKYIDNKIAQTTWVSSCIEQRNQTLYNVSNTIVQTQYDFFMNDALYCNPLRLSDVAKALGVHESTVSRAIHDKYIQFHRGLYPLSYFFMRNVYRQKEELPMTSTESVKKAILEIIGQENRQKPYSDRIISDKLKERNMIISRRTVAKYRLEIGIKDTCGRKVCI